MALIFHRTGTRQDRAIMSIITRMKLKLCPRFAFRFILFSFALVSSSSMAIEEPKFSIEATHDSYEIRVYQPMIVAETQISATFDDAGNQAFRILADYIFGNNTSRTKIDMTAPVNQVQNQATSEKIDMTAPVSQTSVENGFLIQFTMPSRFTMETLPRPNDPRVQIRELPSKRVAVLKYSGSWSEKRFQRKREEFVTALAKDGVQTIGNPSFARYNSPFQLWFLRRNEIWIEIAP